MEEAEDISESTSTYWGVLWYFLLVIFTAIAFGGGFYFIDVLRMRCKSSKTANKRLTILVFVVPIIAFVSLSLLAYFGILHRVLTDGISFGIVSGLLLQLSMKPQGPGSIKLVVQQLDGKCADVWLDSSEQTVGDVRNKIAEALNIHPVHRVCIESGKGIFLETLSIPFIPLIDDSLKTVDFFGYMTLSCYIFVKEDDNANKKLDSSLNIDRPERDKKSNNPFLSILQKSEIRYIEPYALTAKIAGDAKARVNFHVHAIDKFAAAAPNSNLQLLNMNTSTIKLHPWEEDVSSTRTADGLSENGDSVPSTSPTPSSHKPSISSTTSSGLFHKRKHTDYLSAGQPIYHGDVVVLECNGRFMSVARGWWMGWSVSEPKRSGAFIVEIVEKAPVQVNKLKESIDTIKEKMQRGNSLNATALQNKQESVKTTTHHNNNNTNTANATNTTVTNTIAAGGIASVGLTGGERDSVSTKEKNDEHLLRPGDYFRLRSVKFPNFELGLTSVTLRDEYCYLGLRKVLYCIVFYLFVLSYLM